MSLAAAALDALFPRHCAGCGRAGALGFCAACAESIPTPLEPICETCGIEIADSSLSHRCRGCLDHPPAFRRARACAVYDASQPRSRTLRDALHRYKYERDLGAVAPLAALLTDRCPLDLREYDVLVPVPLHLSRLRWRGFNQAQHLIAPLARRRALPCELFALERVRATSPQVRLDAAARRRNVHGAFAVTRPQALRRRTVLLFDDVFTSGATVDACAREILGAGAGAVDVLTLAHAVVP